jgi:hypothetical protein
MIFLVAPINYIRYLLNTLYFVKQIPYICVRKFPVI